MAHARKRNKRAAKKPAASVVRILESADPIDELRIYLDSKLGIASIEAGQVVLGAAQLLLPTIDHDEAAALLDLVLDYWDALPDPIGFHEREFLRNAFEAVGDDPERITRLLERVPPEPGAELLFAIARSLAVAGSREAMLDAARAALATGATAAQFRREDDFIPFEADPEFAEMLGDAETTRAIAAIVAPHVPRVRAALDDAIAAVRDFDGIVVLNPPATLDAILAAERASDIALPDDYRALLTLHDGLRLWDEAFLGTADYTIGTDLAASARDYLDGATRDGSEHLVPLSNRGARSWLLYDPRGAYRRGPGYVLRIETNAYPQRGVAEFLDGLTAAARDMVSKLN